MDMLIKYSTMKRCISLILATVLLISVFPMQAKATEFALKDRIIVSLGDSYSSGEGIEPFYGQDDSLSEKVKNEDWLAHRSKNAWPGMLTIPGVTGAMADNLDTHWFFAASSGAETKHLRKKQKKEYSKGGSLTGHWGSEANVSGTGYVSPQLDVFSELGDQKADYVTITIGGNDADFAGIIIDVVLGSTYLNLSGLSNKLNATWDKFYAEDGIGDNLSASYKVIAEKAGAQAHILVAGYPQLLDANGKGLFVSKEEAQLVNTAVTNFNDAIEQVVIESRNSGINISFVSVEEEFEGHGAYSDDPYINEVIFGPILQAQDLKDVGTSSAYSIHPNYEGACAYAKCVQKKINEICDDAGYESVDSDTPATPIVTTYYEKTCDCEETGYSYSIPQINLDSPEIDAINQEISDYRELFHVCGEEDEFIIWSISYTYSIVGDILSLSLCYEDGKLAENYRVYTISISEKREVTEEKVLDTYGMSLDEYTQIVKDALSVAFIEIWNYSDEVMEDWRYCLKETLSDENLSKAKPFFNADGKLCVLGSVGVPAGSGWMRNVIELENLAITQEQRDRLQQLLEYEKKPQNTENFQDSELYEYAVQNIPSPIYDWYYDDFDYDGIKEAFVAAGDTSYEGRRSLWYVGYWNGAPVEECIIEENIFSEEEPSWWYFDNGSYEEPNILILDECKLFVVDHRHGFDSIWSVKDGMSFEVELPWDHDYYWISQDPETGTVVAGEKREDFGYVLEFDHSNMSFYETGEIVEDVEEYY